MTIYVHVKIVYQHLREDQVINWRGKHRKKRKHIFLQLKQKLSFVPVYLFYHKDLTRRTINCRRNRMWTYALYFVLKTLPVYIVEFIGHLCRFFSGSLMIISGAFSVAS